VDKRGTNTQKNPVFGEKKGGVSQHSFCEFLCFFLKNLKIFWLFFSKIDKFCKKY
jgi:hypothetical protein